MSIRRMTSWLLGAAVLCIAGTARAQQTPQYMDSAYAYGNAPYSNAAPMPTRPLQPFNPLGVSYDFQPFAPADISNYGGQPKDNRGFFFSYDRLFWTISRPNAADIGDPGQELAILANGVGVNQGGFTIAYQNSWDTSWLNAKPAWGNRWEFGYVDANDYGWLVTVIDHVAQTQSMELDNATVLFRDPLNMLRGYYDLNGDGYDDDLNDNGQYGRDGIDADRNRIPETRVIDAVTGLPVPDLGDRGRLIPRFSQLFAQNQTLLNGVEVLRTYRLPVLHSGAYFDFMVGARYFQVDDEFTLQSGNNRVLSAIAGNGGTVFEARSIIDDFFSNTRMKNDIIGPEIGGRWFHQRGRWIFSVDGRFTAGANFQHGQQVNQVSTQAFEAAHNQIIQVPVIVNTTTGGVTTQSVGTQLIQAVQTLANTNPTIIPTGSKSTSNATTFTPLGEIRLQTSYQLTRSFAIKAGYNAILAHGITRASNRVDYVYPYMGIKDNDALRNQTLFINGLNFGLEFNR